MHHDRKVKEIYFHMDKIEMHNQPEQPKIKKSFGLVLKTVERCNIDCTYCYFFNGIDDSFKKHSPYISTPVIDRLCDFLLEGVREIGITDLTIGLHGGEPMMQKLDNFDFMCTQFRDKLEPHLDTLTFTMQTNAMLVNNDWLYLLRKHRVGLGVSIDGPKEYNDKYRIDKRGKGTYDRVVDGINLLQKYLLTKSGNNIGALTVINPEFNGKVIYKHLVDLGFKHMDFLLPDYNYLVKSPYPAEKYSTYLLDIFEEWVKDDDKGIEIRFFDSIIRTLLGGRHDVYGYDRDENEVPLITISSDGHLAPVDELRSTKPNIFNEDTTIFNTKLSSFLNYPIFKELSLAQDNLPSECQLCIWKKSCCGGHLVNRFSKKEGFNNPTIYCESMKKIYPQVVGYLVNAGIDINRIEKNLSIENTVLQES